MDTLNKDDCPEWFQRILQNSGEAQPPDGDNDASNSNQQRQQQQQLDDDTTLNKDDCPEWFQRILQNAGEAQPPDGDNDASNSNQQRQQQQQLDGDTFQVPPLSLPHPAVSQSQVDIPAESGEEYAISDDGLVSLILQGLSNLSSENNKRPDKKILQGRAEENEEHETATVQENATREEGVGSHDGSHGGVSPVPDLTKEQGFCDISSLNSDIVMRFCTYLDPTSMVRLSRTCKQFGSRQRLDHRLESSSFSPVERAARLLYNETATEQERNLLPKHHDESYLELYHNLLQLRLPLTFDQLLGRGCRHLFGKRTVRKVPAKDSRRQYRFHSDYGTAIAGSCVMRSGKHFASFQITATRSISIGVIRPMRGGSLDKFARYSHSFNPFYVDLSSKRTGRWSGSDVHCCAFTCEQYTSKSCIWTSWNGPKTNQDWDGREIHGERCPNGCTVGLLLDLDEGTLSVYKNGRRLGLLKRGLEGEYCWFVVMQSGTVTIRRQDIPES